MKLPNLPRTAALSSLLLAVGAACQAVGGGAAAPEADIDVLARWMTGSFSSAAQSVADPDNYFDIRLSMVPIWTERDDGPWLYVEQAAASAILRPYRQRVYHLVALDDTVRSDVYELPGDPLEFAGAWTTPEVFGAFGPDQLAEREGCSIYLARWADGVFAGSTDGDACKSSLRGASYATSGVIVTRELLTSWDRGYDDADQQVWGATAGPYAFVKDAAP